MSRVPQLLAILVIHLTIVGIGILLGLMGEPYFYRRLVALVAAIGETIPTVGPIVAARRC